MTESIKQKVADSRVADIGCARIDYDRLRRCGFPEFIYGAGKTAEQLLKIVEHMVSRTGEAFATRLDEVKGKALQSAFPAGELDWCAGTFMIRPASRPQHGNVAVLCAGTSDLNVAREALNTLHFCGIGAKLYTDVGVACLDRILSLTDELRRADCCIVAAGMEGALPSVVGGLTPVPVIAVPTSVGYGAALGGFAALAGMLNSCSSGMTVVNIDNGFGAACAAVRMLREKSSSSFAERLERKTGIRMPIKMRESLQLDCPEETDIETFFRQHFLDAAGPYRISEYSRITFSAGHQLGVNFSWHADAGTFELFGQGNGPLSAVSAALRNSRLLENFTVEDFCEQTMGENDDAAALAFVGIRSGGPDAPLIYGAGEHTNIDRAAVAALVCALNIRYNLNHEKH